MHEVSRLLLTASVVLAFNIARQREHHRAAGLHLLQKDTTISKVAPNTASMAEEDEDVVSDPKALALHGGPAKQAESESEKHAVLSTPANSSGTALKDMAHVLPVERVDASLHKHMDFGAGDSSGTPGLAASPVLSGSQSDSETPLVSSSKRADNSNPAGPPRKPLVVTLAHYVAENVPRPGESLDSFLLACASTQGAMVLSGVLTLFGFALYAAASSDVDPSEAFEVCCGERRKQAILAKVYAEAKQKRMEVHSEALANGQG